MKFHPSVMQAIEEIDAMIFSGDGLLQPGNMQEFNELLARWGRGAAEAAETIADVQASLDDLEDDEGDDDDDGSWIHDLDMGARG